VLFIDIVGYSKLLVNEQSEQIQKLKQIVCGSEQFRIPEAEGKLLRLPTGDGAALVFAPATGEQRRPVEDPSIIETACDLPISGGWIVAMACRSH
jgi:hypothetical protein